MQTREAKIRQGTASNLEKVVDGLATAPGTSETVTVANILERLGRRSFGPVLFVAALPAMTPVSMVPGLPALLGIIFILVSGQLLFGMRRLWMPQVIRRAHIERAKLERLADWVKPATRQLQKLIRPRLAMLTEPPLVHVVALICFVLGIAMLPLAAVPFTSGLPAAPVALFGLALTVRDGALVIAGFAATAVCAALLVAVLLFGHTILNGLLG